MHVKLSMLLVATFVACTSFARDEQRYPVSAIPEEMKTGMYAVIREREVRVEVNAVNSSSTYQRLVITILNPNAKDYASKSVWYDKLRAIRLFKGTVYDAAGNVIRKLKPTEIHDQSAFDGFSLYSDNRVREADLSQNDYPYTVEFEYIVDHKLLYELPDFYLYQDDEISIQKTSYSITYPATLKPRYKLFRIGEPVVTQADGKETMQWKFENVKPEKFEPLSPPLQLTVPNILAAPNAFEYDGYAGNMKSWEEYGKWNSELNKGRDVLPEATRKKIRELVQNLPSNELKVKALYEYLQSKTRYVSIQLGIGGNQPFPASVVDETGYGDCKALSNYMVAMLKEVGIKGYYTTVNAGMGEIYTDESFPSHQSNHVIVSVPNSADTIWLECTNQTTPFNYLGAFTGDRKAFMITESGGKLVNTHRYSAADNVQSRTAEVFVDIAGNAKAKVRTTYTGIQYETDNLDMILDNQPDDQKKWLQRNTEIPTFDIVAFKMTGTKERIPSAVVSLDLSLARFATASGKRLFLTPNLMNRWSYIPEKNEKRRNNIVLKSTYTHFDTIRYVIPQEFYPEFLPDPVSVRSDFGEYESKYVIDQGSLVYIRRMKRNKGEFPAEKYNALIDFYKTISKTDNTKIVFLNKT